MALQNLRVVEMGQAFAGPWCAEILATLGADVIKVERPEIGDETRRWGPPFWGDTAAVFHTVNGNKKSVALDLKNLQDLDDFLSLLGETDIFLHNMRPGVLEKMGLGPEEMLARFPRLIYGEISAFGHKGPMKMMPGYEILSQAFGGVISITGEADRNPVRCGPSVCDFGSGMCLVIGILAAVNERHRTGKGGLVQTSLFETALSWTSVSATSYLATGETPGRMGANHHLIAPYGYFETETQPIMVACASDVLFRKLADAFGHPEWKTDPRFSSNPARVLNKSEIEPLVADILKGASQDHWLELLTTSGVPCSPVHTVPEALTHPQAEALGMIQTDPDRPEVRSVSLPINLNGERPGLRFGAPELGSSTVSDWDGKE